MRSLVSEYLPYSKQEKEKIWDEGVFVFDTNILLNLYRYSSETREDLLGAFGKLSHRIWMPYHVAYEFMKNRCKVILDTIETYHKKTNSLIDDMESTLSSLRIDKTYINQIVKYIRRKICEYAKQNLTISNADDDEVLERLLDLFENKVGAKYTLSQLDEMKAKALNRYEKSIPPGYKDFKKAKESKDNDNNAYGDYIIWNQMITYANESKRDLIFVVDDRKEDWWEERNGKYFGARQELKVEFMQNTGKRFLIYTMHNFLERLNDMRGYEIAPQTLAETSTLSSSTLKSIKLSISSEMIEKMNLTDFIINETIKQCFKEYKDIFSNVLNDNKIYQSILPKQLISSVVNYEENGNSDRNIKNEIESSID